MHREFDPAVNPFTRPPAMGLYLLTAAAVSLFVADLAGPIQAWLNQQGWDVGTPWPRTIGGFRYAWLAAILGGARSLYSALDALLEGRLGADLAIVLAATAAILLGEPIVAAEVVVIGLVGECLEAITFDRTQAALRSMTELFPLRCWRLDDRGEEVRILTSELKPGDQVVVKAGGKIPADGVVISGRAELNTAALTGESWPRLVEPGAEVLAGMILPDGTLTIRVQAVASATIAGQMVELSARAVASKGRGERLADRLARWFLPVVLAVATLTFAYNWGLARWGLTPGADATVTLTSSAAARIAVYPALAVLVVACPCPLVLATPAAVVAALGRLAGTGILLKRGAALEALAELQGFAFDKTGTLTTGQLQIVQTHRIPPQTRSVAELLTIAVQLEQPSEHPIAKAFRAAAPNVSPATTYTHWQTHPGQGIEATDEAGQHWHLGTASWLASLGVVWPADVPAPQRTHVGLACNGELWGIFELEDRRRPEAVGVVADLSELGLKPLAVLSGDQPGAVQQTLGDIPDLELHGGLLPTEKARWIEQQPGRIGFLGDGLNDAPALARAHVGIAVGSGVDLAAEAGDVVLLGEPLRTLPFLIRLGRQATAIIRFNIIGFGFVLNFLGILLTGWLWPWLGSRPEWIEQAPLAGVLFHQLGSLLVLLNSMRLLRFEAGGTQTRDHGASIRQLAQRLDGWLTRFSVDEAIHEATHYARGILAGGLLLGGVVWGISGVVVVGPGEVAVVQRFGALAGELPPGIHRTWPYPIETIRRFRPEEVRTVEVGFRLLSPESTAQLDRAYAVQSQLRTENQPRGANTPLTWGSAHAGAIVPKPEEALLLTGDGDFIELFATVRYRVARPRAMVAAGREPDGLIRSVAEGAFRDHASRLKFQDLLTTARPQFEAATYRDLETRFRVAVPEDIGIDLLGLTVHDLHPPQEVVSSFHAVAEAIQRRDRDINTAVAQQTRLVKEAQEQALILLNRQRARNEETLTEARATRDVFLAWARSRRELPPHVVRTLPQDPARPEVYQKAYQDRLETHRKLTEFRLLLDTVIFVFRGRDKLLIDADQLPGKRHILLMDPDSGSTRLPPLAFPRAELTPDATPTTRPNP